MGKSTNTSKELQCVGKLEVVRPKPVGFLCGSIPIPTDNSFHAFNSALVPSSQCETVTAPRYRMLPTETDLNMPPMGSSLPEKALPVDYRSLQSRASSGDVPWDGSAITSNLTRKGEALAVTGLVDYGDELDVIAPADIIKQIFKMPYSRARLSVAVYRVGQTLVLNAGPDIDEEERLIRRNQAKSADKSLFSNFAMHSVRMEACDCPPGHSAASSETLKSSSVSDLSESRNHSFKSSDIRSSSDAHKERSSENTAYSEVKKDGLSWGSDKKTNRSKRRDPVRKETTYVGEKSRTNRHEPEKYRHGGNDEFLRVLFWQFHNFRMLLGSDLLLFSNDKYLAVSLHLWDVSRQVTPMTWLDAWLDNVMASVPELAICYHENGVVQGYELLKTDDIFLLKGISEDGTPAFHPYVVQKNGLSVLRFLQKNCTRDPGAYWLYRNAGDDAIQLFDLSIAPQRPPSDSHDDCPSMLPPLVSQRRTDSLLSLGTLLYRTAHRLSLSIASNNKARCARFFKNCLELLDEPGHLVVRACAHEQFARLILNSHEEIGLENGANLFKSEVIVTEAEDDYLVVNDNISDSRGHATYLVEEDNSYAELENLRNSLCGVSQDSSLDKTSLESRSLISAAIMESIHHGIDKEVAICDVAPSPQTVADRISSRLFAVHHVSQAIKNLRWRRQLHDCQPDFDGDSGSEDLDSSGTRFSVCACGDPECIEGCDIREWLPTMKLDHKLWKLILLLGESYLALGEAYMEDEQLLQTLKVIGVACSIYGSVPQYLEDATFISSLLSMSASNEQPKNVSQKQGSDVYGNPRLNVNIGSYDDCAAAEHSSSTYLFWAKAWALVGDVYVQCHAIKGKEASLQLQQKPNGKELRMSSDVVEELVRFKNELSGDKENCSLCSLVNCSCQSDRASSGSNASSSRGDPRNLSQGRRSSKRSRAKNIFHEHVKDVEPLPRGDSARGFQYERGKNKEFNKFEETVNINKTVTAEKSSYFEVSESAHKDSNDRGTYFTEVSPAENASRESSPRARNGGIFQFLRIPPIEDTDELLSAALGCFQEARKVLCGLPSQSTDKESVLKKIGWVCNELGRKRLEMKDRVGAELAFAKAIDAFRQVSDHTNIILINCNLGHGRRALAEELLSNIEYYKANPELHHAYNHALETSKLEYCKSLRFYRAAQSELFSVIDDANDGSTSLKNEVYTQLANTHLRLGMLLAREDTVAMVNGNGSSDEVKHGIHSSIVNKTKKETRRVQVSPNDAIREAISLYESLGELRKQEAAYAYFQLACYQRDCCLRFIEDPNYRSSNGVSKSKSNTFQRVKQYASLAERNWLRAIEFYRAGTHPTMYLTVLRERGALAATLAGTLHSNTTFETALSLLLEGRHVPYGDEEEEKEIPNFSEVKAEFWRQLQHLLKMMLASTLSTALKKPASSSATQSLPSSKNAGEAEKLKELYKMALKSNSFSQLNNMYSLWTAAS